MCSSARYVRGIISTEIDAVWDEVAPMLERAIDPDEFSIDDVKEGLLAKEFQLWAAYHNGVIEAVMTTKIEYYPQSTICLLVHMAGTWERGFTQYLAHIGAWAKENGASKLLMIGRPGWERELKGFFKKQSVILERKLWDH